MLLSVIIVSYNTQDLTLQTLNSVVAEINAQALLKDKTEIIVIDNNSPDGSYKALQKWQKSATVPMVLVKNRHNEGFAKANNLGIEKAQGQYLFLLNSDTLVKKGSIAQLVQAFEDYPPQEQTAHLEKSSATDRLGILSPILVTKNEELQSQGGDLPTLGALTAQLLLIDDIPVIGRWLKTTQHTGSRFMSRLKKHRTRYSGAKKVKLIPQGWVAGTAMMIRREVIEEVGLLDSNIFMYGEDMEFCLRAAHHHWDCAIHPQATIIHLGSASSSSLNAIKGEFRGYVYIWSKHMKSWQIPILKWLLKTGAALRWIIFGTMIRIPEKARTYQELLRARL